MTNEHRQRTPEARRRWDRIGGLAVYSEQMAELAERCLALAPDVTDGPPNDIDASNAENAAEHFAKVRLLLDKIDACMSRRGALGPISWEPVDPNELDA